MKIESTDPQVAYAVAIATGKGNNGNEYANVLVSNIDKRSTRSPWSIYLDMADEDLLKQLGNPTVKRSEDGSRLVTPFEKPIALKGKWVFVSVTHAPYKVNDKIIRSAYTVVPDGQPVRPAATAAVQRGFDRAESFFKGQQFLADYKQFVLFELTAEELEALLNQTEELED